MVELVAQGEQSQQCLRRRLPDGDPVMLGRSRDCWDVPWEPWLSRRHVRLRWQDEALRVQKEPTATNPIFFRGEDADSFRIKPGEQFVIGGTVFSVEVGSESESGSRPDRDVLHAFTISRDNLKHVAFRDAPHRLDVLGHLAKVIESAPRTSELYDQAVNLLLDGIRRADVACLIELSPSDSRTPVHILSSAERSNASAFRPSSRLIKKALLHEDKSVVHIWNKQDDVGANFTLMGNFDWAFCTPLHEKDKKLGIYVAGRLFEATTASAIAPWHSNDLTEDVKFAELLAAIIIALQQNRELQHRQSVLSHFFSPGVLEIVSQSDPETALRPTETEVTVLFCDLRGFSRKVEQQSDRLSEILGRVSLALGVMTKCILKHEGVVADFLGDCAMAFWGWPISDRQDIHNACLAALAIRSEFQRITQDRSHPLADFRVGIGLATGNAVAGQIGSEEQAKVTVFGPVVNLASRLEGLTKILRVPILIDENTAAFAKAHMSSKIARCRRLARVRPYGLETALDVSELLLPTTPQAVLTDEHIASYEAALDAFLKGDWSNAYELLHSIPPQDLGKDLLISYILQHNHAPPASWDGVIAMQSKG